MTKAELLKAIHARRAEIEVLWTGATDEQLNQRPGPQAEWSMKDLIAHLTFWEQDMVNSVATGQLTAAWHEDTDAVNTRAYAANKDRPVAEVFNAYRQSLEQINALVASLTEEDLNSITRLQTPDNMTLWAYIADETFEHYREHLESVRQWAKRERIVS